MLPEIKATSYIESATFFSHWLKTSTAVTLKDIKIITTQMDDVTTYAT